jgi:Fanconi anemia group M protein
MITVDMHEYSNHEKAVEEELGHRETEVIELPAGDFAVEGQRGKALIERKEWTDFVGAYRSGTLFNQLHRCLEQPHDTYVLIEGSKKDPIEYSGARRLELRRMWSSLHFKSPVQVIETNSFRQTLKAVADADDWLGQEPDETKHSVRPAEKIPSEDRPRFIVEGLPKIGATNAERLLTYFGSAYAVMTASVEELQEVDGIGPKRAESIVEAVNRKH